MNTPSHIILHLGLQKYFGDNKNIKIPKSFVFGALAPDIGLYLCVLLYIPLSIYVYGNSAEYTFRHMFDTLYFEHPLWIFAYNILHSPTTLIIFLCTILLFQNYLGRYAIIIKWFLLGCLLHSAFDTPLHHDDGPRIFYPFSDYVFMSPISYWDMNYYARYVIPVELFGAISILVYILYSPIKNKLLGKK